METEIQKGFSKPEVVPLLIGKDEMNFVEFPFGPITDGGCNTMVVRRSTFDNSIKRSVVRELTITGSEKFGLPRPVDEQLMVGLQALTHESKFSSRKVEFSQYQLCRTLGWPPDGRAYRRIEQCLDRLVNTTFKFKNGWWDKGEKSWRSHAFHLIDNYELCGRSRYSERRNQLGQRSQKLRCPSWFLRSLYRLRPHSS